MVSRFELAPWIITTGGPAASRGPRSTMLSLAPATSTISPCAGYARCRARTPACVISARTASAATTTTDIICNVRMALGTKELRFYRGAVSRPNEGFPAVLRAPSHKHHREILYNDISSTYFCHVTRARHQGSRLSTQSTGTRAGRQGFIPGTIGGVFDAHQTDRSRDQPDCGQLQRRRPRRAEGAAAGQRAAGAYPAHVYPYPACLKKFPHSWVLKEREIKPILRQSPLTVRSAALRSFDLTLLKPCSIGLKSGEYCGRYLLPKLVGLGVVAVEGVECSLKLVWQLEWIEFAGLTTPLFWHLCADMIPQVP